MNREEFKHYHEVDLLDFQKYIESIGFKHNVTDYYHYYKKYIIDLYYDEYYDFFNGSKWIKKIEFNDLALLEKEFKKELRSIKFKKILG